MTRLSKLNSIQQEIEALRSMSRDELLERWGKLNGCPPYKGARDVTLIRGITFKIQEKRQGGLRPSTGRQLLKIAKACKSTNQVVSSMPTINRPRVQTGCKLIREWNGRTYEVLVAEKGYVLNGVTYASLSACAKVITGAHWSGPRFFGARS